jgi:putative transposase
LKSAVRAAFGLDAARSLNTGTGTLAPHAVMMPYQRVQFDGHHVDGTYTLLVPHPDGGFNEIVVERPWLLVVQDVVTRAMLGWHLSLNTEYNQSDVLKCVRSSVEPWKPKQLTIRGLSYHKSGGMPSGSHEKLLWAVWAEMSYDNGKAQLTDWVRAQITGALGGAVNPGPVKMPERRGIIEALFRVLEEKYLHRMPNTTGSNPQDPRRDEPEKAAKKYHISLAHLEELLEVIIANYNGQPNKAIGWRSPLEQLQFLADEEDVLIRRLREEERSKVNLLAMQVTRTVRGNIKKGRRPYIEYMDERYTNEVLARSPDLIGTELTLVVDTRDLRTLMAFLPNGAELGVLGAMGKWAQTPHSLTTRKASNSRRVLKVQHNADPSNVDPVHALMEDLSQEAQTSKRAAAKYEQIRKDADLPPDFDPTAAISAKAGFSVPKQPVTRLRSPRRSIVY